MNSTGYLRSDQRATAPPTAAAQATLLASHFAFMRALLQGVDAQTSWRRYLAVEGRPGTAHDFQHAIDGIKNAFLVAAKQHGRPGTARLVMLALSAQVEKAAAPATLADFVAKNRLDDFSEAEQLGLYAQHFGIRDRRRAKLITRQLNALAWLQQVTSTPGRQQALIADWLDARLAGRLAAAGLLRTQDLVQRMLRRDRRWWSGIDRIGAVKAARIAALLPPQAVQIDEAVATTERAAAALSDRAIIAPLRAQAATFQAGDPDGCLRAQPVHCQSTAHADLVALRCWLQASRNRSAKRVARSETPAPAWPTSGALLDAGVVAPALAGAPGAAGQDSLFVPTWDFLDNLSNTQRAYWKEAERFLLWLMIERRTALLALSRQDCSAYLAFLDAPDARWCGQRGRDKANPLWRPFEGPLSPRAKAYAAGVLRCLCGFLVEQGYMTSSPWPAAGDGRVPPRQPRRFDPRAWQLIDAVQQQLTPSSANFRLQVAIALLRCGTACLGDLVRASIDDLVVPSDSPHGVQLRLRGANKPGRTVSISAETLHLLEAYFTARGLSLPLQAPLNQGARLLGRATDAPQRAPWAPCGREPVDPRAGIGLGTMADQLRLFFQSCAQACADDAVLEAKFRAASSHWLRGGPAHQAGGSDRQ